MKKDLLFLTFIAAFGGLIVGIDTSLIHQSFPYFKDYFGLTNSGEVMTYAATIMGCVLGSRFTGSFLERHGDRQMLKITALLFIVSSIGSAISSIYSVFILFRIIAGLGIGAISVITPTFLAEIAPQRFRGRIVLSFPVFIIIGVLSGWILGLFFDDSVSNNWRWMFLCLVAPVLLFLFLLFFTLRSPRWTMRKGYDRETSFVLRLLNPLADIDLAMQEIKETFPMTITRKKNRHSFKINLFSKMFIPLTGLVIICQFSGYVFVDQITDQLFNDKNLSPDLSLFGTLITSAVKLAGIIFAISVIDKTGRIPLIFKGIFSIASLLLIMAVVSMIGSTHPLLQILLALGFHFCFYFSFGSIIWVYIPEVIPNLYRARGLSAVFALFWLTQLITYLLFLFMASFTGNGIVLIIYSILTFIWYFFLRKKLVIETKGKSLEELDKEVRTRYIPEIKV